MRQPRCVKGSNPRARVLGLLPSCEIINSGCAGPTNVSSDFAPDASLFILRRRSHRGGDVQERRFQVPHDLFQLGVAGSAVPGLSPSRRDKTLRNSRFSRKMSRVDSNRSNIPRSSSSVTGFELAAGAVALGVQSQWFLSTLIVSNIACGSYCVYCGPSHPQARSLEVGCSAG